MYQAEVVTVNINFHGKEESVKSPLSQTAFL